MYKKIQIPNYQSVLCVNFQSLLSEFNSIGHMKVLHGKRSKAFILFFMISTLTIILLPDNAWPHVGKKLTDKEYKTLPHSPYSPDFPTPDYHF